MTQNLKVLIVGLNYEPEPLGIAPDTTGMARMLADGGHDVHVITGFPHYPQWRIAAGHRGRLIEETDGAIRITRVRHPVPMKPVGPGRITMEAVFALHSAMVRTHRPDVVITVSPALLAVAAGLIQRRGHRRAGLGVVLHDLYTKAIAEASALGGHGGRAVRALERTLLTRADNVAVIHHALRDSLVRMGIEQSKITVIRNWTHISSRDGDTAAVRVALAWPEHRIIALHAGNMGAKQGLENVVEAARLADEHAIPITFVLIGAGHQRAHLATMAAGIESIRFVDPLTDDQFEAAIAAADVLVLNERPEVAEMCAPSKLTSYFAAGRPVIAATRSGSPAAQEIDAAEAGLVLPPGEPRLLLAAALEIGRDPARADALGRNGRRYASTIYAESAARRAYLAWVSQLAERRTRIDTRADA